MASGLARDPVAEKGMELFRLMEAGPPALFDRRRWTGRLMTSVFAHADWKVRLFRFIDVFPALRTPEEFARHVRDYFLAGEPPFPWAVRKLLAAATRPATAALAVLATRRGIARLGRNFIAGKTPADALPALRRIRDGGRSFTVDILGEAAVSEEEALRHSGLVLSLIDTLADEVGGWGSRDAGREERFPRVNVSVKVSSLYSRIGPVNYDDSVARLRERLRPVFRKAREKGAFVNLDMETRNLKDITLDAFVALLDEPELRGWEGAGIALQAYLRETPSDLRRLAAWARSGGRRITVRLVKGAYWEHETIVARQKGWPLPVFSEKSHTDRQFERCVETILDNADCLTLAAGTHNIRSIAATLVAAEGRGIPPGRYEFQMLYGMAEPVKSALARLGHPVREYVPVGALVPGMAYLVRRLLENSSNEGFLRKAFAEGTSPGRLLAEPRGPG
ncbi:MAG: proline dehydrogenase family protein, partial [Deltaproteobacteria bacterium]|nr:proline dehydrogenase family protein [Deltaproteobacteria bacterium]